MEVKSLDVSSSPKPDAEDKVPSPDETYPKKKMEMYNLTNTKKDSSYHRYLMLPLHLVSATVTTSKNHFVKFYLSLANRIVERSNLFINKLSYK